MPIDEWDLLITLTRKLVTTDDRAAALSAEPPDATVIELWDMVHIEQEMFIRAAACMAERLGVAMLRIDAPDARPDIIIAIGTDQDDARRRVRCFYEARQAEVESGLEEVD